MHPASTPITPNAGRARTITLLFWAHIVVLAINALVCLVAANETSESSPMYYTGEITTAQIAVIAAGLIGLVKGVLFILLAVFFIQWLRRAYHNLHKAGSKNLRHSEGWAAGAWFVPFLNLVWPYQVVRDTWEETQNVFRPQPLGYEKKEDNITGWWWASYLIAGFISNIGSFAIRRQNFELGYFMTAMGDLTYILAAFLAIRMIQSISAMEDEMLQRAQQYYAWLSQQYADQYQNQQNPQSPQYQPLDGQHGPQEPPAPPVE